MRLSNIVEHFPDWIRNIAVLAAVIIASFALREILYFGITQWLKMRRYLPEKTPVKQHFRPTGFLLMLALLLHLVFDLFHFPANAVPIIAQSFHVLLIVAATWFLIRSTHFVQLLLFEKFDIAVADNMYQRKVRTQIQFIVKLVVLFIAIAGFASVLMNFQGVRRLGASLLASAGVASVVIGFAAQKSLSNIIAGFQIAFTQPIRMDDVVIVENEWGRVEEITLSYVVVKLWDLRRLILPITYFTEKPFQNWTRNSPNILGYAYLYVDYSLPVEELRKELRRYVETDALWDRGVCILQVTETTERTMQLRALVSARNASDAFDLRCNIREALINFIREKYPDGLPRERLSAQGVSFSPHEKTIEQKPEKLPG